MTFNIPLPGEGLHVTLDDDQSRTVECAGLGDTWNGYATPLFTVKQLPAVCDLFNDEYWSATLHDGGKKLIITSKDSEPLEFSTNSEGLIDMGEMFSWSVVGPYSNLGYEDTQRGHLLRATHSMLHLLDQAHSKLGKTDNVEATADVALSVLKHWIMKAEAAVKNG